MRRVTHRSQLLRVISFGQGSKPNDGVRFRGHRANHIGERSPIMKSKSRHRGRTRSL